LPPHKRYPDPFRFNLNINLSCRFFFPSHFYLFCLYLDEAISPSSCKTPTEITFNNLLAELEEVQNQLSTTTSNPSVSNHQANDDIPVPPQSNHNRVDFSSEIQEVTSPLEYDTESDEGSISESFSEHSNSSPSEDEEDVSSKSSSSPEPSDSSGTESEELDLDNNNNDDDDEENRADIEFNDPNDISTDSSDLQTSSFIEEVKQEICKFEDVDVSDLGPNLDTFLEDLNTFIRKNRYSRILKSEKMKDLPKVLATESLPLKIHKDLMMTSSSASSSTSKYEFNNNNNNNSNNNNTSLTSQQMDTISPTQMKSSSQKELYDQKELERRRAKDRERRARREMQKEQEEKDRQAQTEYTREEKMQLILKKLNEANVKKVKSLFN